MCGDDSDAASDVQEEERAMMALKRERQGAVELAQRELATMRQQLQRRFVCRTLRLARPVCLAALLCHSDRGFEHDYNEPRIRGIRPRT